MSEQVDVIKKPFYVQWHITSRCNLHCEHCYQRNTSLISELDEANLQKIADKLDDMAAANNLKLAVSITGGEPFFRKDVIFKLLSYLQNKEHIDALQILSNGLLLGEEEVVALKKIKKLKGLQVSLESPDKAIHDQIRGKGNFEKVVEKIAFLKEHGIKISVMMTISKLNYKQIAEMNELLKKLKVDIFGVDRFIPETKSDFDKSALRPEEIKEAFQTLHDLSQTQQSPRISLNRPLYCLTGEKGTCGARCSAAMSSFAILPDGRMLPCRRLPIPIGNVLKDDIVKIWNTSPVLTALRDVSKLTGKCQNCEYVKQCKGCRASAYAVYGDFMKEDPFCWKENK